MRRERETRWSRSEGICLFQISAADLSFFSVSLAAELAGRGLASDETITNIQDNTNFQLVILSHCFYIGFFFVHLMLKCSKFTVERPFPI